MESPTYSVRKTDGVSIGENPQFEERWSKFSRWSWFVLSVFVAMGATGIFGKGPLAEEAAGTPKDPMYLKYERFARFQTPSILSVVVTPKTVLNHNEVHIFISNSLAKTLNAQKSNPHPSRTVLANGGEILEYPGQPDANLKLRLVQTFPNFGVIHGRISLPGQMNIPVRQIIYP